MFVLPCVCMCVWEGGLLCPLHPLCLFDVFFFLPFAHPSFPGAAAVAYRPDGGIVLLAEWGSGDPLAGVETGGCGPSPHSFVPTPSPAGRPGSSWCSLSLLFASPSGFSGSAVVQIPALPVPCCVTSGNDFTSLSSVL